MGLSVWNQVDNSKYFCLSSINKKILEKNGINILPPNVNVSNKTFTVGENDKTVMFGLLAIKNLGHDFIDTIINERRLNGKFTSFYSFCKRVHDIVPR